MKKWSRTPKHIMRRDCVASVFKHWSPAKFVEFGAGTGDMTSLFLERGFTGKCYDLGEDNRQILRQNLAQYAAQLDVVDDLGELQEEQFDYLFAFEVLEHIENDAEVLAMWSAHLKPGGLALISVPAHMSKFSREDEAVGHVRRYEKTELIGLLERCGYEDIRVLNHGFPLGNITWFISRLISRQEHTHDSLSAVERSIKSGVERKGLVNRLAFLFNDLTLMPFNWLQRLFFNRDWGDGYVAYARKRR